MQADRDLERALHCINRKISLPEEEVRRKNDILAKVVDLFITEMKNDSLFEELYERAFYGDSFYDRLRVGEPNEFDIHILLRIPKRMSPIIRVTKVPGFVNCKILKRPLDKNTTFLSMINREGFIEATSVSEWMEGITAEALNTLCLRRKLKVLSYTFPIKTLKSGPPMTIHFIPCFVFRENEWPRGGYRPNPIPDKPEFFIVPKPPKRQNLPYNYELLWRLSFQEQEIKMIEDKQCLKPALKLLKRLRDKQGHNDIASYYIKTIFLWEVEANDKIFNSSLADSFLAMQDKYIEWLENEEIPYFWYKKKNLLEEVLPSTLENYANRLKNVRKRMNSSTIKAYM